MRENASVLTYAISGNANLMVNIPLVSFVAVNVSQSMQMPLQYTQTTSLSCVAMQTTSFSLLFGAVWLRETTPPQMQSLSTYTSVSYIQNSSRIAAGEEKYVRYGLCN